VHVRTHEPAQVDADAKRIAIKLKGDAPAKVEFEVQVPNWFVIDARIETIIAHEVCGTRGYAGGSITLAVFRRSARTAFGSGATPVHAADHRLIPQGSDIVSGGREAEIGGIVFDAAVELRVITIGDERTMKKSRVHHSVADASVEERREISKGVVDMVRQIPGGMTSAEALFGVTGGSRQVNGRAVVQGRVGIVQPEVREESTNANTGDCAWIVFLDRGGGADKVQRHACVNSKVA